MTARQRDSKTAGQYDIETVSLTDERQQDRETIRQRYMTQVVDLLRWRQYDRETV